MMKRRAFTLTELLVAIVMLVGVLLAVGKIFSTTSKVAGAGESTADIIQDAMAIGRLLQDDLQNIAHDGVLGIRCRAVPNDLHGAGAPLINPLLPPEALVRSDQLVFFTTKEQGVQTFRAGSTANQRAVAISSRIYWGHGFQLLEEGLPADDQLRSYDVQKFADAFPWSNGAVEGSVATVRTIQDGFVGGNNVFQASSADAIQLPFIDARRWLLLRQPVALLNDDDANINSNAKTVFLNEITTARTVFLDDPYLNDGDYSQPIRDGRVDAAATVMSDVEDRIRFDGSGDELEWADQYAIISSDLIYTPRAERYAPSMSRVDQALTNNIIGSACSSFRVEWTYDDGVGELRDFDDTILYEGVVMDADFEQVWFGLADDEHPEWGVRSFEQFEDDVQDAETIDWQNIETLPANAPEPFIRVYEAIFGYNRTRFLDDSGNVDDSLGYTPWPNAIRVTMTLHDPAVRNEAGREFQFVIRLPDPPER